MDEFIDLKIRKFQQFIVDYINSVDELPVEVKRLAVMEILHELDLKSNQMIDAQQKELRQRSEVKKDAESI